MTQTGPNDATTAMSLQTSPSCWRRYLGECFEIDVRSLAALRIGMAILMLWDLASRSVDFNRFYPDNSAAPRWLFMGEGWSSIVRSLYFVSGQPAFIAAMFALHTLFALLLLVGFRTQLAVVACFVMQLSLVNRNVMMTHSGDGLLLWMLVWSMFLPLGAAGSVDALTARTPAPLKIRSLASVAMLMQIVFLYSGAVISKTLPEWRSEFSAVYFFLSSHLGTPLGRAVAKHTFLCELLTMATMALEAVGPLIALLSPRIPWLRVSVVMIFTFFHISLGATLYVGTFAYVCVAAWFPYLPGVLWEAMAANSLGRAAIISWNRFVGAIARMIESMASYCVAAAIRWPRGVTARLVVLGLLLYVAFVNVRVDLPESISRKLGPLNRLPQAKQTWGVMHMPPHMSTRLALRATLADGTKQTLLDPAATLPDEMRVYLWSPWSGREMKYRLEALMAASNGITKYADALCAYEQRRWDGSHAPVQHVASIDVLCADEDIVPIEMAGVMEGGSNEAVIYTWKAPGL